MSSCVRFVQVRTSKLMLIQVIGRLVLVRSGYIWLGHVSTGYVCNSRFSSGSVMLVHFRPR